MTVNCSWESCDDDPKRFKVQVGGSDGDLLRVVGPVKELTRFVESLAPSHKIQLSFKRFRTREIAEVLSTVIPIFQACRSAATELEVIFEVGHEKGDQFCCQVLSHEAAKQAISKILFKCWCTEDPQGRTTWNLTSPLGTTWNLIEPLRKLENLRSLEFGSHRDGLRILDLWHWRRHWRERHGNDPELLTQLMSQLLQVKLSDTCRKFVICYDEFLNRGGNEEATNLVKFLGRNKQINCLKLFGVHPSSTQIIAEYLQEEVTGLSHLEFAMLDNEANMRQPCQYHHQLAQQTPSIFAALTSIEFTQDITLQLAIDEEAVAFVDQLAQNMKGSRQLVISDPLAHGIFELENEPENYPGALRSFLSAAVGASSNLAEFDLEFYTWRLEPVAAALEAVLPKLSTRLQKLKLVVVPDCWEMEEEEEFALDVEKSNAFQARIVAALGGNTDLLALKSFDLDLQYKGTNVIDENTKKQFNAFVANKSIQRICGDATFRIYAEDAEFHRAAFFEVLDLIHSSNLDRFLCSQTVLFHCLRSDAAAAKKVAAYLEMDDGENAEEGENADEAVEENDNTGSNKRKRDDDDVGSPEGIQE